MDGAHATTVRSDDLDNPNSVAIVDGQLYVLDSHYKQRRPDDSDDATPGRLYTVDSDGTEWSEVTALTGLKV